MYLQKQCLFPHQYMIEHHQRKVKINEKVIKSINNSEFGQNEKNMRKRKGSPRERW